MPDTLNADVRLRLDLATVDPIALRQTGYLAGPGGRNNSGSGVASFSLTGWLERRYGVRIPTGEPVYVSLQADMTATPSVTDARAVQSGHQNQFWLGVGRTALAPDTRQANTPAALTAATADFRGGGGVGAGEEIAAGHLPANRSGVTGPTDSMEWTWTYSTGQPGRYTRLDDTALIVNWLAFGVLNYTVAGASGIELILGGTIDIEIIRFVSEVQASISPATSNSLRALTAAVAAGYETVGAQTGGSAISLQGSKTATVLSGPDIAADQIYELRTAASSVLIDGADIAALTASAAPAPGAAVDLRDRSHLALSWRDGAGFVAEDVLLGRTEQDKLMVQWEVPQALTSVQYLQLRRRAPVELAAATAGIDDRLAEVADDVGQLEADQTAQDFTLTPEGDPITVEQVTEPSNTITGVAAATGGGYGAGGFRWWQADTSPPPANLYEVLIPVDSLAASPPERLYGRYSSADRFSTVLGFVRNPAADTSAHWGYRNSPGDPAITNEAGIRGAGTQFSVSLYHDAALRTPVVLSGTHTDLPWTWPDAPGLTGGYLLRVSGYHDVHFDGPALDRLPIGQWLDEPLYRDDTGARHGEIRIGKTLAGDTYTARVHMTVTGTYTGVQAVGRAPRTDYGGGITAAQVEGLITAQVGRRNADEVEAIYEALWDDGPATPATITVTTEFAAHPITGSPALAPNTRVSLTLGHGYDRRYLIDADDILAVPGAKAGDTLGDQHYVIEAERDGDPSGLHVYLSHDGGAPLIAYDAAGSYSGVRLAEAKPNLDSHIDARIQALTRTDQFVGPLIADSGQLPGSGLGISARLRPPWTLSPGIDGVSVAGGDLQFTPAAFAGWMGFVFETDYIGGGTEQVLARAIMTIGQLVDFEPGTADIQIGPRLGSGIVNAAGDWNPSTGRLSSFVWIRQASQDDGSARLRLFSANPTPLTYNADVRVRIYALVGAPSVSAGAGLTQAQVDARVRAVVDARAVAGNTARWPLGRIPDGGDLAGELNALSGPDRLSYASLRDTPPARQGPTASASLGLWEAHADLSLAQANPAPGAEQQLSITSSVIEDGMGISVSMDQVAVGADTPQRLYILEYDIEVEARTFTGSATDGANRLFFELYVKVNGVIDESSRRLHYMRASSPWSPSPQHFGGAIAERLQPGDTVTFHVVRVGGASSVNGSSVAEWRINAAGSELKIDTFDIVGGSGSGGSGGQAAGLDRSAVQQLIASSLAPVNRELDDLEVELEETSALTAGLYEETAAPWQAISPYHVVTLARRIDGATFRRGGFHRLYIDRYGGPSQGLGIVSDTEVLAHGAVGPDDQLSAANGLEIDLVDGVGQMTGEHAWLGSGPDGAAYISFDAVAPSQGGLWRVRLQPLARSASPVIHDDTLTGSGTRTLPLGVATHADLPPAASQLGSRDAVLARLNVTADEMSAADLAQIDELLETVREYLLDEYDPARVVSRRGSTAAVWMTAQAYQLRAQGIAEVDLYEMAQTEAADRLLRGLRTYRLG